MELLVHGEMVRTLPRCGHSYHTKCIDRWLLDSQAHQRRRCPLCNTDPIETVAVSGLAHPRALVRPDTCTAS